MRRPATRDRIRALLAALADAADGPTDVYLVGGTTAVVHGWRDTTGDVDLVLRPESDRLIRAIATLKDALDINVELAAPHEFIPVAEGWEDRSPMVERIGPLTVRHYDLVAQALAKLERSHTRDVADVRAMLARGLITPARVWQAFDAIAPRLYRYTALDEASFRASVAAVVSPPP